MVRIWKFKIQGLPKVWKGHPIKTVLIVDDNVLLLEMLDEVLSFEGFKVLQAHNGRTAFEMIRSHDAIDVVISDIQMPGGDGLELMKRLHALDHPRKPGLILVTGSLAALSFNPDDYGVLAVSEKPLDFEMVIRTIQSFSPLHYAKNLEKEQVSL